jgi:hypothetical protein
VSARQEEIPPLVQVELLKAFRYWLAEEWEAWEDPDGCHCKDHRESLRWNLYAGLELGLDVEELLTIRDYPVEGAGSAYEDVRPEVEPRVRLTRPEAMAPLE